VGLERAWLGRLLEGHEDVDAVPRARPNIYRLLAVLGLQPKETSALFDMMWFCTKSTAIGAKMGIFTPMYLFVCRKSGKTE
jgi:hypothetical protein